MRRGTIKVYKIDRGYGFVRPEDGGEDLFFHITTAQAANIYAPTAGMAVEFEEGPGKGRRPSVTAMRLLQDAAPARAIHRETAEAVWRNQ